MIRIEQRPARPRPGASLNTELAGPLPDVPARRLRLALLTSAVVDLDEHRPRYAADRTAAVAWIAGADAVLPFAVLCHWLDLDPDRARVMLLARAAQPRGE